MPSAYGAFSIDPPPASALSSDAMLSRMSSRITSAACTVQITPAAPTFTDSDEPTPQVYFSLDATNNDDCPMTMSFDIESQISPAENYTITAMNYSYAASDTSFDAMNDVNGITLNGGVSLTGMGTSSANVSMQVSGEINSQKLGNIPVSIQGILQGATPDGALTGVIVWQFQFSDFMASFEQDYTKGAITYSLNGNPITQAAFDAYFESAGDPFYYVSGIDRVTPSEN